MSCSSFINYYSQSERLIHILAFNQHDVFIFLQNEIIYLLWVTATKG